MPFEVPRGAELRRAARVGARGDLSDLQRGLRRRPRATTGCGPSCARTRCGSARVLAGLAPDEPEVHGLVALMELQASRLARAHRTATGEPVLLLDQDRARWDRAARSAAASRRWRAPRARRDAAPRRSVHAAGRDRRVSRARRDGRGDRLAADRRALRRARRSARRRRSSSSIARSRSAMAFGPGAGLALVDALVATSRRSRLSPAAGVRGDLLAKLGRRDEARAEFQRAAELTRNERERDVLLARARDGAPGDSLRCCGRRQR